MSEQETAVQAPVAKPKKARKPAKKPMHITGQQHRVLQCLARLAPGSAITRQKIAEKAFNGNSVNFKPILGPLVKAGLVHADEIDVDGKTEQSFSATVPGRKVAKEPAPTRGSAEHQSLPKVGGKIKKTYKGKEIEVKVKADGFEYKGKTYSSLSAAAKAVRGDDTEVNGWLFFGLTK